MARRTPKPSERTTEAYKFDEEAVLRPDAGTQAQFKKRMDPRRYRYDNSLSPALNWDGQNPARELGEWLLRQIEEAARLAPPHEFPEARSYGGLEVAGLTDAVASLKRISAQFLDWSGKAERLSFDVPTLPLFVHERLSTKAILETLKGHERDRQMEFQLFADPQLPLHQQLAAYEHRGGWTNRMILGDSLVAMNSLLEYEGLGGQVQMVYIDPPYGVKFGSNFQPFVRNRAVEDNQDSDMTREPEMVQAYRDTWEIGIHSYLTYLRDRLLVARELLAATGSIFVQISDENVHHVRELMDETFGVENRLGQISFLRGGTQTTAKGLAANADFLLWYGRDFKAAKINPLLISDGGWASRSQDIWIEREGGARERYSGESLRAGERLFTHRAMESARETGSTLNRFAIEFEGREFWPKRGWSTTPEGAQRLAEQRRLLRVGNTLRFVVYLDDFPYSGLTSNWTDTIESGFAAERIYVVQTARKVVERCMLLATQPGDLVLDPTCGSGTTAHVAEQWGRRWITIDTSRVPLALARQRLLTATYPYYALQDEKRGPSGGFVYRRRQNNKGQEVGGIVPHITLKSLANDEPPTEDVLVDKPEVEKNVTRVTGPFAFEATIPTPVDLDEDGIEDSGLPTDAGYIDRMLEALRRNPVLQLGGNTTVTLRGVKPPARSLYLSAEAYLDPGEKSAAILFGPENGAISEKLVYEAVTEANVKKFDQLLVIGFAIEPNAREFITKAEQMVGIPVAYIQATPDIVMGDLLKTMRSSQLFSVAGLPDISIRKIPPTDKGDPQQYEVELLGLDTFDPTTFEVRHRRGEDVPAWFLDTDWNDLSFLVSQAFFPRTSAWDALKKSLRGEYDDSVWDHLAGTISAPFVAGENRQIAVKVIDDRGNELLVVKSLEDAK